MHVMSCSIILKVGQNITIEIDCQIMSRHSTSKSDNDYEKINY